MKSPLSYNLHGHTYRCGHAGGKDEDYVLRAIEAGFKEIAFTDHVMLPGITQPGIRGDYALKDNYFNSVLSLKEKYKDQIKIHLGFEAEWYGDTFKAYYEDLLALPYFDLLIVGQHCYLEDGTQKWYASLPFEERLPRYQKDLLDAMASGLFTYVAHPDLYVDWNQRWDDRTIGVAHEIAKASKKYNIPLELNFVRVRANPEQARKPDTLSYPCPMFWDIVSQYDCDVVIGVDAHWPEHYRDSDYGFMVEFIQKHHLKLLTKCPLEGK